MNCPPSVGELLAKRRSLLRLLRRLQRLLRGRRRVSGRGRGKGHVAAEGVSGEELSLKDSETAADEVGIGQLGHGAGHISTDDGFVVGLRKEKTKQAAAFCSLLFDRFGYRI